MPEIAAVVLVGPTNQSDDDKRDADDGNPYSNREAQKCETDGKAKNEWPPTPRTEMTQLGVGVIDVCLWSIFGQKYSTLGPIDCV